MPELTAGIMDERGDELESCQLQFRDVGGRRQFSGRIRTVRCLEDNVLVKQLLGEPGAGLVLVVDGAGSLRTALLGDKLASTAAGSGWEGVTIHGAVRDIAVLRTVDIGIRALGSQPRRSAKGGAGEIDVTVSFGGATFRPGADRWCHEDGIVVSR